MQRRDALKVGSAATLASALHARAYAADSPKLRRVALIGAGWFGKHDITRLCQVENVDVVAVCDVDQKMMQNAAEIFKSRHASKKMPLLFGDYRKLLADENPDIVYIASPDHWHALHAISAIEAGADVYVQKPISCDVLEGKAMVDAARKHNRVVQVGLQRRSKPHLVRCREEIIGGGLLGDIAHVDTCCYLGMGHDRRAKQVPVPEGFDYEMWTGPAPMMPFTNIHHPQSWRAFKEYGNGIIGDMGVHMFDIVRWMLDIGWPKKISSSGGTYVETETVSNTPDTQIATFEYDDLNVIWNHRTWGPAADPKYPWSAILYGNQGTLKISVNNWEFIPRGKGKTLSGGTEQDFQRYPEDQTDRELFRFDTSAAPALRGHAKNFLNAIDQRGRPVADIEQGHISSASCILANLSMELGRSLEWDPETHTVVGDEEATMRLRRTYRAPWTHPADA